MHRTIPTKLALLGALITASAIANPLLAKRQVGSRGIDIGATANINFKTYATSGCTTKTTFNNPAVLAGQDAEASVPYQVFWNDTFDSSNNTVGSYAISSNMAEGQQLDLDGK